MTEAPKRVKRPESSIPDGHRLIANAVNGVTEAIREAFGPRTEIKIVHDEVPPLLDQIRTVKFEPGQAERFGGHEETLIGREDLEKITPFYESTEDRRVRLLAEIRARALLLAGYVEEDQPSADGSAQNDLAHERADAIMAFVDLARGHSLPRKLLPRGDRRGDWLPPGTPVKIFGLHDAVVAAEEDRVRVTMAGYPHPVSFPRSAVAKEGETWTPPKHTP